MTKKYFNIALALLSFWSYNAYSQINCTVPLSPVLTSVSVQPETGNTDFKWTPSLSSDIAAYIIYSYKNGDAMPIDTVWDPSATGFTITTTATKYFSVSYVITAHRLSAVPGLPGCTSPLSNVLSTIFCSSEIDTCNKKIMVRWNRYADYPKHVSEYKILVSVNGGSLSELYSTGSSSDNFTISDFSTDSQYCFAVKAILEDGTVSNSNKSCLNTKMRRPPEWINADYATINPENNITLSFTIDPLSEIKNYILERKTGQLGTFLVIANPVADNGKVIFTDNKADISIINYYRLSAINSCNIPVTISNVSSNMVLSLNTIGEDLILSWNPYKKWLGTISEYKLFMDAGNGYQEKTGILPNDTVFKLSYRDIMYDISGGEVCFYIDATESSNPHGVTGESHSSKACTVPAELITVPNVFTPDNDLHNDFFRPVLSFTPVEYHLVISDRKGNVLFETRDYLAAWDGTRNGSPQIQGVYLWFLKVTTPSGKKESRTGTVTIFRSK